MVPAVLRVRQTFPFTTTGIIPRLCHVRRPRHPRHPCHLRHLRHLRYPRYQRYLRHWRHLRHQHLMDVRAFYAFYGIYILHALRIIDYTLTTTLIGESSTDCRIPIMSENFEPDSIPRCFSPNLISIFGHSTANPRRQKNIDRKRQFVREKLEGHGVIAWSLRHKQSVWERCNWDELRRLVHDTDARPRQWPGYVREHLIVLSTTTLSDSQAFVELCSSEYL